MSVAGPSGYKRARVIINPEDQDFEDVSVDDLAVAGELDVAGVATFADDVDIAGTLTAVAITATGLVTGDGLDAGSGDVDATGAGNFGSLDVGAGNATISAGGALTIVGEAAVASLDVGSTAAVVEANGDATFASVDTGAGTISTSGAVEAGTLAITTGHATTGIDVGLAGNDRLALGPRRFQFFEGTATEYGAMFTANGLTYDATSNAADDMAFQCAGGFVFNADSNTNGITGSNTYAFRVCVGQTTGTIGNEPQIRFHQDGYFVFPKSASDPSSEETGAVYYNTTSNTLQFYNGTSWGAV